MTAYSPAQLATIAAGAGFTGPQLTRAVAVALAESGGNPQAVNVNHDKYRSRDRGLWQINSHWHPEVSDAQAFDPAGAAKAAYSISSGGRDWSAWSTWKSGAAQAQLARAKTGAARARQSGKLAAAATPAGFGLPDIPDNIPGVPAPLDPLDQWHHLHEAIPDPLGAIKDQGEAIVSGVKALVKAGAWIADPHNWERVAWVTGGSFGILVALYMIGKSGAVDTAASTAGAATDATKAAGSTVKGAASKAVEVAALVPK